MQIEKRTLAQLKEMSVASINRSNGQFPESGEFFTVKRDEGKEMGAVRMDFLGGQYCTDAMIELLEGLDNEMPGIQHLFGFKIWTAGMRVVLRRYVGKMGHEVIFENMSELIDVLSQELIAQSGNLNKEREAIDKAKHALKMIEKDRELVTLIQKNMNEYNLPKETSIAMAHGFTKIDIQVLTALYDKTENDPEYFDNQLDNALNVLNEARAELSKAVKNLKNNA